MPHGTPRTLIPLLAAVLLALPALGFPAASATPHTLSSGTTTSATEPGPEPRGRTGEPTPDPGGPRDTRDRYRPGRDRAPTGPRPRRPGDRSPTAFGPAGRTPRAAAENPGRTPGLPLLRAEFRPHALFRQPDAPPTARQEDSPHMPTLIATPRAPGRTPGRPAPHPTPPEVHTRTVRAHHTGPRARTVR